jgi:hypothetical protein
MLPNHAIDGDTYQAPLRTLVGARHRERWAASEAH